jgi:hypothetical protein
MTRRCHRDLSEFARLLRTLNILLELSRLNPPALAPQLCTPGGTRVYGALLLAPVYLDSYNKLYYDIYCAAWRRM